MELNKMGLAPMEEFEMQEINGGGFLKRFIPVVGPILGALEVAATAWDCGYAFGQGLVDGYKGKKQKK
ncbi:MAG: hypothetical protein MUF43_11820 [Flavobacterium sp.]|nr:hypothetical protein [Flavobacterium sp.]